MIVLIDKMLKSVQCELYVSVLTDSMFKDICDVRSIVIIVPIDTTPKATSHEPFLRNIHEAEQN